MEVTNGAPGLSFRDEAEAATFARLLGEAIWRGWKVRQAEPPRLLADVRKDLDAALRAGRGRMDSQATSRSGPVQAAPGQLPPSSDQPVTLIGTEMAARLANVHPRTVRKWIKRGLVDARPGPRGAHLVDVATLAMQISRNRKGDDEREAA